MPDKIGPRSKPTSPAFRNIDNAAPLALRGAISATKVNGAAPINEPAAHMLTHAAANLTSEVLAAIARIAIDESIVVGPITFLAVNVYMSFDYGTKPIREVMAIPENRNPS